LCAALYDLRRDKLAYSALRFPVGAPQLKEGKMIDKFDDVQKYGKDQFEAAAAVTNSIAKAIQEIANETADYSRKSFESGSAFLEKLLGAKTYESAIQLHSEYWKSSYAEFIAQATKLGELYSGLAKETFKPFECAFARYNGKV
jgi:hypothetical protein